LVIAAPVGLAFGSQEQGGIRLLAVEVLGEAEPVGDEEHRGPPRTGPGRSRSSRSPAIAATIWSRFRSRAKERSVAISPAARAPADSNPGLPSEDCAIGMPCHPASKAVSRSHQSHGQLRRAPSPCFSLYSSGEYGNKLVIMNDLRYYVL